MREDGKTANDLPPSRCLQTNRNALQTLARFGWPGGINAGWNMRTTEQLRASLKEPGDFKIARDEHGTVAITAVQEEAAHPIFTGGRQNNPQEA
jgi:hypothetical protein